MSNHDVFSAIQKVFNSLEPSKRPDEIEVVVIYSSVKHNVANVLGTYLLNSENDPRGAEIARDIWNKLFPESKR